MTPKEKANELTQRFELIDREHRYQDELNLFEAKQCALICVDEILNNRGIPFYFQFWTEVKQEIEKL